MFAAERCCWTAGASQECRLAGALERGLEQPPISLGRKLSPAEEKGHASSLIATSPYSGKIFCQPGAGVTGGIQAW